MSTSCARWAACLLAAAGVGSMVAVAAPPSYAPVTANQQLVFPLDYGSHPQFRTEWWYVTGWLSTADGESLGFQITFFRTKPNIDESNPSAFAPHQLLVAHCAISDPKRGRLWQDQRIRRAGLGLAEAATGDTHVWIDRWSLKRNRQEMFSMPRVAAFRNFVLNHMIHHRGQLSVYLRLTNVPVPAIYGPSADEG